MPHAALSCSTCAVGTRCLLPGPCSGAEVECDPTVLVNLQTLRVTSACTQHECLSSPGQGGTFCVHLLANNISHDRRWGASVCNQRVYCPVPARAATLVENVPSAAGLQGARAQGPGGRHPRTNRPPCRRNKRRSEPRLQQLRSGGAAACRRKRSRSGRKELVAAVQHAISGTSAVQASNGWFLPRR